MPWGEKTVEKLRKEFVQEAEKPDANISCLCREFSISRKTGYKWLHRSKTEKNLGNQSRKPKRTANKTNEKTEELIVALRGEHPGWGAKKLHYILTNQGHSLPSVRTVNSILSRNGCISDEESDKRKPYLRFEKERCNEMWQADFKGDFPLLDGSRCFPLTILDDHSRFSIKIETKTSAKEPKEGFLGAFLEYGKPNSILTDNGAQFAGFRGGYTQLERWLMDHDVLPIHGRIMHPQTQGKIERFHRSMKQELLKHRQFTDVKEADRCLQQWRILYNEVRPHEALGMRCPSEVYKRSGREYKDLVSKYEPGSAWHAIKVNSWGYLRFDQWQTYLSETFADTYLEFRPNPLGDSFLVCYRNFKIAEVDPSTGKLINRRIYRL